MSVTTKLSLPLFGATSPESAHPVGVNHDGACAILDNAAIVVAAPSTATSTGQPGQIAYDATHIYVCVATNVWVRATLATF
jgi:hypothetical protein